MDCGITAHGKIPEETYEYIVNGKSAIEWIMDRYAVITDKDSGITNDTNDWCTEHNNTRYIIDPIKRIVTYLFRCPCTPVVHGNFRGSWKVITCIWMHLRSTAFILDRMNKIHYRHMLRTF